MNPDNTWIAYKNILSVYKKQPNLTGQQHTVVQFFDGQAIALNISMHTLQRQMKRTFQLIYEIESMKSDDYYNTKNE